MKITVEPIAVVKNSRSKIEDDYWSTIHSEIVLNNSIIEEAFNGVEEFSHLEIIFYMNQVSDENAVVQYRHPRNNKSLPKLGTFAQRNKNRPNKLGLTIVELTKREGRTLFVRNLDAIDGTPILDIKPVFKEFLPLKEVVQPNWTKEIMKNYW